MTAGADSLQLLATVAATSGLAGLLGLSLLERVLPIVPSSVLLVAFGIGASAGYWSLPAALAVSTLGSLAGCLAIYRLGALLGEERASRLLGRLALGLGMHAKSFDSLLEGIRSRRRHLAFVAQIVPTMRLIAPGVAGFMRTDLREFAIATVLGVVLWNLVFIGMGFLFAPSVAEFGAAIALIPLAAVIAAAALWWFRERRRGAATDSSTVPMSARRDLYLFVRSFLRAPSRVGAIAPSGPALARLITSRVPRDGAPVIELGPGTGVFTRALVAGGIPEQDLVLVEQGGEFAGALQSRFPAAQVLAIDAAKLHRLELLDGRLAGSAISGLPLRSMSPRTIMATLGATFEHMRHDAGLYQFTYGLRCPVPRPILDRLGLKAARVGTTFANIPPASVYCIRRRVTRRKRVAVSERHASLPRT